MISQNRGEATSGQHHQCWRRMAQAAALSQQDPGGQNVLAPDESWVGCLPTSLNCCFLRFILISHPPSYQMALLLLRVHKKAHGKQN